MNVSWARWSVQLDLSWFHQYLTWFITIQPVYWLILIISSTQRDTIKLFSIWLHCLYVTDTTCEQTEPVTFSAARIDSTTTRHHRHFICLSNLKVVCSCALWKHKTLIKLYQSSAVTWYQERFAHGLSGCYVSNVTVLSGNRLYCIYSFHWTSNISEMKQF